MKKKPAAFIVFVLGFFILTAVAYSVGPEEGGAERSVAASADQLEDQGFDIVLLMDSSGSMKKTDPRNYRKDSARLFISLMGTDDKVGVVSFGDSARTLIPPTSNTRNNRTALFSAVNKVSSKEFSTDITGAVKQGFKELQSSKRKNRILILMSDGKLALGDPKKDEASLNELMKLLPDLKTAGIRIYSIAFSELSDPKFLGDIAEKTGGFFRYAATDKDIHIMFTSIFEKIKSPDSLALQGDSFTIDKDIREAVLLITKQAGTLTVLLDPSGKKNIQGKSAKNVQWYSSHIFDMITIQEPVAGHWKVKLSSREGNKIFILTNLKLKSSSFGNTLNKGDNALIDAWLEKDGKKVADREVLSQISFSAEIIDPDRSSLKVPLLGKEGTDLGLYSAAVNIGQAGEYTVRLSAEGKTFNRTKDILFRAVEPTPSSVVKVQPQPAERPTPRQATEGQIDWDMTLLFLGLVDFILLALAVILFIWGRRYKKLYLVTRNGQSALTVQAPVEVPQGIEEESQIEAQDIPEVIEEKSEIAENLEQGIISEPQVEAETAQQKESPGSVEEEKQVEEDAPDSDRIRKLLGIIDFQRNKIAELVQVKDVLEDARGRLSALPARSREMNDKVKAIAESHGLTDEVDGPLSAIEEDVSDMVSYMVVLEKEETRLADKFRQWEEELKKLLAGEEYIPRAILAEPAGSAGKITELEVKLTEMEDQLLSKDRKLKALEKQYEDVEKEYMILYHAAQKQKQQQQPNI